VSVDAAANHRPINPNIYGIAYGDAHDMQVLNAPLNRWGGNSTTRYNWQIDAHSAASDWYFETYSDGSGAPSGSADQFLATTRSANNGAQPLFTIPMIDYLANLGLNRSTLAGFSVKKYGAQTGTDPWNSDAGNGVSAATGKNITGNNPLDTGVANSTAIQQAWVQHFVNTFGASTSANGVRYYILDNEPSLWHSTHRDVHPSPSTYQEMYNKIVAYATAIRAADPNAKIVGFEEWSWWAMYFSGLDQANGASAANSDYNTHNQTYYYPWLLQQLYAYKQQTGTQLLDVLTVHCYNALPGSNDDSLSGQQARNRETRILWDPTFQDPSWYGDIGINGRVLNWIPTLRAMVNQYHPGLQIGCTEYNWGDEPNLNGATTQADVLGIYGREGFDLATRWTVAKNTGTTPTTYYPTYLASQIYRNYDGNNGAFGDTSVSATAPNPDNLSTFAATRSSDGALTVMVINKQQGSTPVTVSLANFGTTGTAQAWQINSTSQATIARLADVAVSNNAITTTVPSQSITLFVIPAGAVTTPPPAPAGLAANVGNGAVTLAWNTAAGATSYSVKRATVSGGPYATIGTPATATYADSGLTNGTTYYYVVSASNSAGTSANSGEIAATPIAPPTFTSSATASPNPVAQGTPTTITAAITDATGTLANGIVQILVVDSGGNTVASQNFTGQSFTTGQKQTYTLAFTAAASGSFTVRLGVFSATWQTWHWNNAAASISVTSSLSFSSSATVSPASVPRGTGTSITATVTDTGTASLSNANIEVQVFNSSGSAVSTNVWSGQNFTGGQSHQYTYTWSVPSTQATGNYTVMIGVFDAGWATNYYWNSNGATITVTTGQTAPATPTGLTATAGNAQVNLSWTASAGAATYNVYRGTAAGAESATPIATGITATTYTNTGLTNGTTYYYKATAVNSSGTSAMSNEASAKPVAVATNVTSLVRITSTSFTYSKSSKTYNSTVTVQNTTQQSIAGPLELVLTNLPAGITLANASGTTGGSPYITITGGALAPGRSASVKIQVQASSASQISYTPAVYSGVF
jgi:fibronectin type 3 domain-containing protein